MPWRGGTKPEAKPSQDRLERERDELWSEYHFSTKSNHTPTNAIHILVGFALMPPEWWQVREDFADARKRTTIIWISDFKSGIPHDAWIYVLKNIKALHLLKVLSNIMLNIHVLKSSTLASMSISREKAFLWLSSTIFYSLVVSISRIVTGCF